MWFDFLVAAILLFTTARGAAKGIAWQLAGIAALVLCFLFATPLSLAVAPMIGLKPPLNRWVAMLGIYLVFSFATYTTARSFKDWLEKKRFEEYDRHLGAIFGFAKGVVGCLVLTFFAVTISESMRQVVLKTYSGYAAARIMDQLHPVMPEELHAVLEPYIHKLDGAIPEELSGSDEQEEEQENDQDPFLENDEDPFLDRPKNRPLPKRKTKKVVEKEEPGLDDILNEALSRVPGLAEQGLESLFSDTISGLSVEDRESLLADLERTVPTAFESVLKGWHSSVSEGTRPAPDPVGSVPKTGRSGKLLEEIADVLISDSPRVRDGFISDIKKQLSGLSETAAENVIVDWHSDLLGIGDDPDPSTTIETPLEERIGKQKGTRPKRKTSSPRRIEDD